jgi:Protein of unknown function (DUF3616)
LADFVDLPGGDAEEAADIEGLARSGHFLWAVGSHSLRRRQVKSGQGEAKALKRLSRVEDQANREILVRLPIADVDGRLTRVRKIVVAGQRHRVAQLGARDGLRTLLRDDDHRRRRAGNARRRTRRGADPRAGARLRRGRRPRRGTGADRTAGGQDGPGGVRPASGRDRPPPRSG